MDRAWLIGVIRRLHNDVKGNDLALARKFGLKRSGHIKKYMLDKGGMTPNVETCLRIAGVAGEHPSDVLRAAGHGPVVAVIESAYANAGASKLATPDPAVALDDYTQTLLMVVAALTDLEREEVRNFAAFVALRRDARSAKPQQMISTALSVARPQSSGRKSKKSA